ncbi:MAG: hypothetical protein R3D55_03495 [Chloroflexota bacterium]
MCPVLCPSRFDLVVKTIGIGDPIWPDVGETAVLTQMKTFYANVQGRHPAQFSLETIRPRLRDG